MQGYEYTYHPATYLAAGLRRSQYFKRRQQDSKVVRITHAVAIRYLSELCDGLLLIWSIETFPTICRAFCVCFILIGTGFGVSLAYILREKL